jgi:hypothetical protein
LVRYVVFDGLVLTASVFVSPTFIETLLGKDTPVMGTSAIVAFAFVAALVPDAAETFSADIGITVPPIRASDRAAMTKFFLILDAD